MSQDADRFWSLVDKSEGCWLFRGCAEKYGVYINDQKRPESAHRLAYRLVKGDIPSGYIIMHMCDTPGCVRPDHLEPGTHSQNMYDRYAKGRHRVRPVPPRTELGIEYLTIKEVAERLSVSRVTVYNFINAGKLEAVKIGKSRRIALSALLRFIEAEQKTAAAGKDPA